MLDYVIRNNTIAPLKQLPIGVMTREVVFHGLSNINRFAGMEFPVMDEPFTVLEHSIAVADKGEYSTEIDLLNTHEAEKSDFDAVEKMFKARGYNVKHTGTHSMKISW